HASQEPYRRDGELRAMMGGPGPMMIRGFGEDSGLTRQKVKPGTTRRILPYARPYRWLITALLLLSAVGAVAQVAAPLLLRVVIEQGIFPRDKARVILFALAVAGLALVEAAMTFAETWLSGRISEGLVYDLRSQVFDHVQRQPIAFFTRTQTGALVSRLN